MLATVAAAHSARTVREKYSIFIYSEAEPHAMYAIYKQTLTLCVLQYIKDSSLVYSNICIYLIIKPHSVWKSVFIKIPHMHTKISSLSAMYMKLSFHIFFVVL